MKLSERTKIVLLRILAFVISVLPIAITVLVNKNKYFSSLEGSVRLSFGIVIALFFFAVKASGAMKTPRLISVFAIVFVLSYLLSSLIEDLTLLSGMALLGEFLENIFVVPILERKKKAEFASEISSAVAEKLKDIPGGGGV